MESWVHQSRRLPGFSYWMTPWQPSRPLLAKTVQTSIATFGEKVAIVLCKISQKDKEAMWFKTRLGTEGQNWVAALQRAKSLRHYEGKIV